VPTIQKKKRDRSEPLGPKSRKRLTDIGMALVPIDDLAAENSEIARRLIEERMNPTAERELLLKLEANNEKIRRVLTVQFLKMMALGAELQPYWELEDE
jgi:hypothetical protein